MSAPYEGQRQPHSNRRQFSRPGNPLTHRRLGGWARPTIVASCLALGLFTGWLCAETIPIPNASFELPALTGPYGVLLDSWQKTPKPVWWDEAQNGPWEQLVGVFTNVAPSDPRHIENCEGNQAIWLFSVPTAGLFQDYDSIDWSNSVPTHAFDTRFIVGRACRLTVGVRLGVYPMTPGAQLELALYYRDAASNQLTVATLSITNTFSEFTNTTRMIDFQVTVPTVASTDPWAGQRLGIRMLSTIPSEIGGLWELDNVRLESFGPPTLSAPAVTDGHFTFTLESEPGTRFEILGSADLALPSAEWTSVGFVTNDTGRVAFTDPTPLGPQRFYRAKQLP